MYYLGQKGLKAADRTGANLHTKRGGEHTVYTCSKGYSYKTTNGEFAIAHQAACDGNR
ncbi:hypothetical protein MGG_17591 [Pyricularia oryzae 70-15]|uniref:Uncharacterized protein n=3 Tax=Pyricularia oryzae TaxID=318829 RepID=G4NFZ8_PYRO7|nr:uncharacterized protein MGG_17591 [Pyricularia oryzae 70-15]EHA46955.1 hypothetical protein MGG_17591 [Pyricularia oryzae 70-15]ELQ40657.1 hypothetical protein OOU_Y34scaffold00405g3 [Pyricularia oryzae Y34]